MKQYILECILACLYIFEGVAFESFLMNKLFGYRFCVKKAASVMFFSFLLLIYFNSNVHMLSYFIKLLTIMARYSISLSLYR